MTGKVWLVGAGPSDPGLFTLKGSKVLKEAQVVVYDALVGQGILTMMPWDAELINVGKRADNHTMPQEEISLLLAQKALEGKRVVRLKGGDPFLFGRGGEEIEVLKKKNIPYEVVPGVTSAISVPAYNGIPVTHRDYCSSLHIVTGHKKKGQKYDIDFEALVRTNGTLVFLMGISALADICGGLLNAGMDPHMPAAVLQKGTTSRQKRIVAEVVTLEDEVKRQGIETPAIIVVGKVCALAGEFDWYGQLPLAGKKILVTRPRQLISVMSEKLREKGAEVLELPAISTFPIENNQKLQSAFERLSSYQWIVFTSPTGVQVFFEEMKKQQVDMRKIAGAKFAVIGTGTKRELDARGIFADLMPKEYDGGQLGIALANVLMGKERILIPRAKLGNKELIRELSRAEGIEIDEVSTYDTLYERHSLIDEKAEIEAGNIDYAVFTSASTVRGFARAVNEMDYSKVKAVCIGRQTQEEAQKLGMQTFVSKKAEMDSIIECLEELCR